MTLLLLLETAKVCSTPNIEYFKTTKQYFGFSTCWQSYYGTRDLCFGRCSNLTEYSGNPTYPVRVGNLIVLLVEHFGYLSLESTGRSYLALFL